MTLATPSTRNATRSPDWWRGAVIYQIYPRSFADSNGDGVGDLPGIVEKLPYVASLGVDAIWISPFFRSPMKDFGYDVEDYRDVDPLFGTLADFDRLVARAHSLGLKVMIDQVLSHTADTHAWFKESRSSRDNPKADWYVWGDGKPDGTPPSNWLSVFGGPAWQWGTRRQQYYLHNFLAAQPDLNLHCEAVQQQVLADIRFWLDRGVDGFRFDACNFQFHDRLLRDNPAAPPPEPGVAPSVNPYDKQVHLYDKNQPDNLPFFERIRALLNEYGAASVGEIGDRNALDLMVAYSSGKRLHMTYSFALLSEDNSAAHVRRQVEDFEAAAAGPVDGGWPCWTVGNHDAPRVTTRWRAGDAPHDYLRAVVAMLSTLRGSFCWYQGDELALPQAEVPFELMQDPYGIAFWPEFDGRDGCRTPMPWQHDRPHAGFCAADGKQPWLPVAAEHAARAVDISEADPDSPLHLVRACLQWRRGIPALVTGPVRFLDAPEPVLALLRTPEAGAGGPAVLAVINLGGERVAVNLPTAPASEAVVLPPLPERQAARRDGGRFELPPYGVYLGTVAL